MPMTDQKDENWWLTPLEAMTRPLSPDSLAAELLSHGTMKVEYYAPIGRDTQTPHTQDELYIIARGTGWFVNGERRHPFGTGDLLFVPAGNEHRFEEFSDDFGTWVIFYGPEGGERP
jgi:mannose-6-phosphate isomerase-like protein (cupin superfamily)